MSDDTHPRQSTIRTGLKCACPRCGRGRLFEGLLTVRARCERCGLDFSRLDSEDGPAFFVILGFSAIVIPAALWLEFTVEPPLWVHVIVWVPVVVAGSIVLLRPIKAWLLAQQFVHKAYRDDGPG